MFLPLSSSKQVLVEKVFNWILSFMISLKQTKYELVSRQNRRLLFQIRVYISFSSMKEGRKEPSGFSKRTRRKTLCSDLWPSASVMLLGLIFPSSSQLWAVLDCLALQPHPVKAIASELDGWRQHSWKGRFNRKTKLLSEGLYSRLTDLSASPTPAPTAAQTPPGSLLYSCWVNT